MGGLELWYNAECIEPLSRLRKFHAEIIHPGLPGIPETPDDLDSRRPASLEKNGRKLGEVTRGDPGRISRGHLIDY